MYNGKEKCQGCKKSGVEVPRYSKDELCKSCSDFLESGKYLKIEDSVEYVGIRQHHHAFRTLDFDDHTCDVLIRDLLHSVDNPYAKKKVKYSCPIKGTTGDNCYYVNIPLRFYEPLIKFGQQIDTLITDIRSQKASIPVLARAALIEEKNRIYNEGIAKGRELLFSLNSGEISMNDFEKKLFYNENKTDRL